MKPCLPFALTCVMLSSLGCDEVMLYDPTELPKEVHIDPAFTPQEHELIVAKIEAVNRDLGGLLGYDILTIGDPLDDPDGFDYDGGDMGDDVHGIYRVPWNTEAYEVLEDLAERDFGGYATVQDVLMFRNLDPLEEIDAKIAAIEAQPGWEDDSELFTEHWFQEQLRETTIWLFRRVVAHELGHHVGLLHNPDSESLMYPEHNGYEDMQDADKKAFCFVRGCTYP